MRRPLWKIHCMTVFLLTGVNIYLLIKLFHCAEKNNDRNRTGEPLADNNAVPDGPVGLAPILGWLSYPAGKRHQGVQIKASPQRKSLQLREATGSLSHRETDVTANKSVSGQSQRPSLSIDDKSPAAASMAGLDGRDLLMLGRWDDSRQFIVRDFALTGKQFYTTAVSHNVCLATQSSLDRLHWIAQVADHWRGAISVAVYLDDEEVHIFRRIIRHLRQCHSDLLANLAFHIVSSDIQSLMTAAFSSSLDLTNPFWTGDDRDDAAEHSSRPLAGNCTGPSEALTWLLKERPSLSAKWESGRIYPQNLMRNVARKGCPSHYVLLLDVDVIPSFNMAESLAEFLDRPSIAAHCPKCAFVVPTYELDYAADFPQNKSQLLTLENEGRAQPFHQKAFRYNQYASNLTR